MRIVPFVAVCAAAALLASAHAATGSVARCSVTWVEPPLANRPYTVVYPIGGERTPGCGRTDWSTAFSRDLPYGGAEHATPAGWVGWS